ncbi:hypothetical protein [Lentibacillus sp. Marseille-P4043]|nr:hypothetical protein [Lentibacillus sp. Marseille-P4043]
MVWQLSIKSLLLITAYDGNIEVKSKRGQGTSIMLRLPHMQNN